MKKSLLLFGMLAFFTGIGNAQPACFSQLDSIETGNNLWADSYAISADQQGSYYITGGRLADSIYYNGNLFINGGGIYLIKFDQNHNLVWIKNGSTGNDLGFSQAVNVDIQDNIIVGGWYEQELIFGNDTLTAQGGGNQNPFITKFRNDGSFMWSKCIFTPGYISGGQIVSLSSDTAGNIYFGGFIDGTLIFGQDTINSWGFGDNFWGKMDSLGNLQWIKAAGSVYVETGSYVAADLQGNVYITGMVGTNLSTSAYFDTVPNFLPYGYIARYSTDGQLQWLVTDQTGFFEGRAIAVSGNGFIAVTGMLAGDTITTIGNASIAVTHVDPVTFVVKLDTSGNVLWIKDAAKSAIQCYGNAILFDNNNQIIISNINPASLEVIIAQDTIELQQGNPSFFLALNSQNGNIISYCYLDATSGRGLTMKGNNVLATGTWWHATNGPKIIFIAEFSPFMIGINENTSYQNHIINLYPNPANDLLNIKVNGFANKKCKIVLTNTMGQILNEKEFETKNNSSEIQLDINNLSSGIYFLSVTSNKIGQIFKLQKQ
ncbi:MAG TPA: T9SS type A sorting domain-containing protein [Bacteroidia bacterium]|nr:T9SS type A sorting domain-containing protein [Bacteroidia bacterium]